ncbi:hypothetical protein [Nocardia africana]
MATSTETENTFWPYFQNLLEVQNVKMTRFAKDLGLSMTTPGTWKERTPTWEMARKVAEYFHRPVSEVFIRCGYATEEELGYQAPPLDDPSKLTNTQLIEELRRRLPTDTEPEPEPEAETPSKAPKTRETRRQSTRQSVKP